MNINQIYNCSIQELADWCAKEFFGEINNSVETPEDLKQIYVQMQKLTNQYSYLASILSYLKFYIRDAKASKNKEVTDNLIDKKEIMQRCLDSVSLKHSTLSRMITIKQEINKELNMNSKVS